MKKSFLLCVITIFPSLAYGELLYSSCPSGYVTIIEKNAKIYGQPWPSDYSAPSSFISSNSCSASTKPAVCYLYAQTGFDFSDTAGTYDFTSICQYEHSSYASTDGGVAVKCVKNNGSTLCTNSSRTSSMDWSNTCSGIQVKGMAYCSSDSGNATNRDTKEYLLRSPNDTSLNRWCWCRVISPGVTPWIFGSEYLTTEQCNTDCAGLCLYMAGDSSNSSYATYRSKIFSNLKP